MHIEDLVQKISNSIDQLGKIFDQIYKMPMKLREKYFDSIQKMKDRLVILKTNAKQTNIAITEKNYKQIYLNIHRLKQEIAEQVNQIHNKENRDYNRPSLKQTRKNHDDAMKLIVEKDQQIEELNLVLFEKEELIRLTFDDLRKYKKESEQMTQQYKITKIALSQLQIEYSSLKSVFIRTEENNIDLQLKDQQRERCFRQAIDELQSLKDQLVAAHQKIEYFEELAEVSIKKTKMVEQNIRMVQIQANSLNQNYRRKQGDNLKKMKEIDDLSLQLNEKNCRNIELQIQVDKLKQQIDMLQFELDRLQKFMHEERGINYEERSRKEAEINKLEDEINRYRQESDELRRQIHSLQDNTKQLENTVQSKSKEVRHITEELEQSKGKVEEYLMMTLNLQNMLQQTTNQLNLLKNEKHLHDEQLQKSLNLSKQLENDIKVYLQKLKLKEQEKVKVILQVQKLHRQIKSNQKDRATIQKQRQELQKDNFQSKTQIIRYEQSLKQKERQLQSLKMRLLRAKIQIIHQIRQQME